MPLCRKSSFMPTYIIVSGSDIFRPFLCHSDHKSMISTPNGVGAMQNSRKKGGAFYGLYRKT